MRYQVQFLDDETFEALPYRDMHEKVGVADPRTMKAFVRKSGLPILDTFNAAHELEHLEDGHEGVHANHYDPEHGVYYKGFGNVLAAVAPLALSVLFPGVGTAIGGALSSLGGGVSSALGAIPGIGGALSGAAQTIGGGIGSALGIGGGAANAGYAANAGKIGSEMGGYGIGSGTAAGSAAASAGGLGGALNSFGGAAKGASNVLGGANSLMSAFGSQQGQMPDYNFGNGSYDPFVSQGGNSPNMIAGASGSGSGGGPGGSPGSVGGGQVSKIKQQLESENSPNAGGFNGGMK